MGISFWGITENNNYVPGIREPDSGCLCSQMAPSWDMYLEGSDLEELAREADPNCPYCKGTGVEPGYEPPAEQGFANANARDLLYLMGLASAPQNIPLDEIVVQCCGDENHQDDMYGNLSVPEMRQHIMMARARFDNKVKSLTYEEEVLYGKPFKDEDGVYQMRPQRVVLPAKTADAIKDRLERLAGFVEAVSRQGATVIRWG